MTGVEFVEHVRQRADTGGQPSAKRAETGVQFREGLIDEDKVRRVKIVCA